MAARLNHSLSLPSKLFYSLFSCFLQNIDINDKFHLEFYTNARERGNFTWSWYPKRKFTDSHNQSNKNNNKSGSCSSCSLSWCTAPVSHAGHGGAWAHVHFVIPVHFRTLLKKKKLRTWRQTCGRSPRLLDGLREITDSNALRLTYTLFITKIFWCTE